MIAAISSSGCLAPQLVTNDLDGFTVRDDLASYLQFNNNPFQASIANDFGFDPCPSVKLEKLTPPDVFLRGLKQEQQSTHLLQLSQSVPHVYPPVVVPFNPYGQLTPPRTDSEPSIDGQNRDQKRGSQGSVKAEVEENKPKRRRRSTKLDAGNPLEKDRRRQSLEKNRLAAAKCRVNKKEKTELLQRDSHEKAVQNAFLREQLVHMKEEIQQMNQMLLTHATCEGCASPADIQHHLTQLSQRQLQHSFMHIPDTRNQPSDFHSPTSHDGFDYLLPSFDERGSDFATSPTHMD